MTSSYNSVAWPSCLGWLATLLLCFGLAGAPAAVAEEPGLSFGLVSVMSAEQNEALWRPLLDSLGRHLAVAVEPYTAQDYAAIVWALKSGRNQLAWLGNASAVEAVDRAGAEVFAQEVYPDGMAGYYSVLIVNTASPLRSAADILAHAGELTFAMGDRNSTSGYVVPRLTLFPPKVDPETAFKRLIHGNHEDNFLAVAEGRADAAAVASNHLDDFARLHPAQAKAVRVIWRSPLIPADPLVWRKDLPPQTKERILAFFLDYGRDGAGKTAAQAAAERKILARLGVGRFVASSDLQLNLVRQLELLGRRLATEADPGLSVEERALRLAEIDRQLTNLH